MNCIIYLKQEAADSHAAHTAAIWSPPQKVAYGLTCTNEDGWGGVPVNHKTSTPPRPFPLFAFCVVINAPGVTGLEPCAQIASPSSGARAATSAIREQSVDSSAVHAHRAHVI